MLIDEKNKKLSVPIILVKGTGKTRIKKRSMLYEYGLPVATRSKPFTMQC